MYGQLLRELRQLEKINKEYADKIEELEDRIEVLESNNGIIKSKKDKKKLKRPEIKDTINPPWEREGLTKKEWQKKKVITQ